jgi:DNA-binding response OmpR family regulator
MKVLIVEDDAAIAANLYDCLASGGYDVDIASNANTALLRQPPLPV